ncbi:MAG: hypothetical protein GXO78_04935 [Calditrichaeota bacterium]|nr:hypothetical protein [Calditrichota bacterium]
MDEAKLKQEVGQLIEAVERITHKLHQSAQQRDWEQFVDYAQQRAILFSRLEALKKQLMEETFPNSKLDQVIAEINEWVVREFQKVAKVDRHIGDIIESEKKKTIESIVHMQKGLEFLSRFKRKANSQKIISRVY